MTKTSLPQVEIIRDDVLHLKAEALRAHRRYLASGSEASYKLYKRLAALWLKTKEKYDQQQADKGKRSLF